MWIRIITKILCFKRSQFDLRVPLMKELTFKLQLQTQKLCKIYLGLCFSDYLQIWQKFIQRLPEVREPFCPRCLSETLKTERIYTA